MDLSSSSISSSVKESSKVSSSKMSSSSISSSSLSSKVYSSLTAAVSDISSEMDELLAAATGSRSSLSGRSGRPSGALTSIDADLEDMLSGTSLSSTGKSSSSVSSSSNKKVSKMSSISQSSMELMEGTGIDSTCKSSVKESSSSLASSASMASETKIVDGQVVKAQTLAEKASVASQGQKEKVIQDGQVLVDTGSKSEVSSAGRLMATKEMSQAELDNFFQQDPAIAGKAVEALNYDKDKKVFEVKK